MKIRGPQFWLAVVCLVLAAATNASALYTPNPAGRWAPGRFFLAGDFDFTTSKDLEGGGEIEDKFGMFVRPAFSVAPNIMIYGRLGVADAEGLDAGFAGGFGVQGAYIFPAAPQWAVGGAFDFLYWQTEGGNSDLDYIEYQFTPAVSYNIPQAPTLTPYAGVSIDFLDSDFEEDNTVGPLFGINFDPTSHVRLDAQVRFVTETGFLISAGYMF